MICSNCNALIPDDTVFCPECGAWAEPAQTAPDESDGQIACPSCENCGAEVGSAPEVAAPEVANPETPKKFRIGRIFDFISSKTKIPVKLLKWGMAGVALIVVAVIAIAIIIAGIKSNYALYIKNGALMYTKLPNGKPVEITEESAHSYWMTKDGKRLFYIENRKLYYVDVTNTNSEPQQLESRVSTYKINEDGSRVFYTKDMELYWCDLKGNCQKIQSDVSNYWIADDGKTVIYIVPKEIGSAESKHDLYRATVSGGKVTTRIIHSNERIEFKNLSKDGKTVVYMAERSIYIQTGSQNAERIAVDAYLESEVYDDGSFYYDVHQEADNVKDQYALYYYDGKKSLKVAEKYYGYATYAADAAVMAFCAGKDKKTDNGTELEWRYYVAVKGKASEVKLDNVTTISLRPDGKEALILAYDDPETQTRILYKAAVGSEIKEPKKVDIENVDLIGYTPDGKNTIYYTDGVKERYYTLYINGKKISDEVNYVICTEESEMIVYVTDYDSRAGTRTLWSVSGGKKKKIDDEIYDYKFTPDGTLLYLADREDKVGTLYYSTGGPGKVIDTEVSSICSVNTFTD